MFTLADAKAHRRTTKAPPGRATANQWLKTCRMKLGDVPGKQIDIAKETSFNWLAYLAEHKEAAKIFCSPVVKFVAEVFPEREPNQAKLMNETLRVDFVALRADGTAVRIHPHKQKEATVVEGNLENWRKGVCPLYVPEHHAVSEVRLRETVATRQQVYRQDGCHTNQPPPPPGPPPSQLFSRERECLLASHSPLPFGPPSSQHAQSLAGLQPSPQRSLLERSSPNTEVVDPFEFRVRSTHGFDGSEYGVDYLSFPPGALITVLPTPESEASTAWAYGILGSDSLDSGTPTNIGWFPPDYVRAELSTPAVADSVLPADSVSDSASSLGNFDDLSNIGDYFSNDASSKASGCSTVGGKCFSRGTLLQKPNGHWMPVEDFCQFDYVTGKEGQFVQIMAVGWNFGTQRLMEVCTSETRLVTTPSHRFMVRRGRRVGPHPASSLRLGDDVEQSSHNGVHINQVTSIREFFRETDVFEIEFKNDEEVKAIMTEAIVTKGRRPLRTHRCQREPPRVVEDQPSELLSIPMTQNEAEWF